MPRRDCILQVKFPVFQELPQLPTPFGTLFYTEVCVEWQTYTSMQVLCSEFRGKPSSHLIDDFVIN